MSKLTWKRLDNGDQQANEYPIRLVKPARGMTAPGWRIRTPFDRDSMYDDGWAWADVYDEAGREPLEAFAIKPARALAEQHLAHLLTKIPTDYGQPAPESTPKPEPAPVTPDPYEQIGAPRPNANGWPVLLPLTSVQYAALLALTEHLDDGRETTRVLREIHVKLIHLDPKGA